VDPPPESHPIVNPPITSRHCDLRNLHLVTYENGMRMQESLVALRQRDEIDDQLLLLEHPPVITLGRGGKRENLLASPEMLDAWGVSFHETTRGGDITYHGPGQLVGYPLIHLGEGRRDVRKYVERLEETLIRTVAHFGITATRWEGKRGIWVGREKIGAIGVRVARWVTSHGFALNVDPNLAHFRLITPCGLHGTGVTSISRLARESVPMETVRRIYAAEFADVFERDLVLREHDLRLVKVVVHDGERVLLLRRTESCGGFWQPVTGRIEEGEADAAAAARETEEETGVRAEVRPLDLRQSFAIDPPYAERITMTDEVAYEARVDRSAPISIDAEEHDRFEWFDFAEARRVLMWSDDLEAIERLEARLAASRGATVDLAATEKG
jgi:lipoyl(octanoyl) transferase